MPETLCPVCGYDLKLASVDDLVEMCPSCGFGFLEFERHKPLPVGHFARDNVFVYLHRILWLEAKMPWASLTVPEPAHRDPIRQMQLIGENFGESYAAWLKANQDMKILTSDDSIQQSLEMIDKKGWKPEVIEALWDGDTTGWYLGLYISRNERDERGKYKRTSLWFYGYRGDGYHRYKRADENWPTALIIAHVGIKLAEKFDVPFWFPSPVDADDDCPGWWEKREDRRCASCGKYLGDRRKNEICYHCELNQRYP